MIYIRWGKLSFCCKVFRAGRIFLHRMIDLNSPVSCLHHLVSLTIAAKSDLQWWLDFLLKWLGTSLILNKKWVSSPALHLFTDATGLHSWGAYCDGYWLQSCWSSKQDVNQMERIVCHSAGSTHMGSYWSWQKILLYCDNHAAVATRAPHTMALVRLLYLCTSNYHINVCLIHVPGICNEITDSLSQLQIGC